MVYLLFFCSGLSGLIYQVAWLSGSQSPNP
jgi:hypothetical protein